MHTHLAYLQYEESKRGPLTLVNAIKITSNWLRSLVFLAQALFRNRAQERHWKHWENKKQENEREYLQEKERIESLGGNWSGFKIKLREVRDGGREGKRELRGAFNDDFFLSCSFHILFFFLLLRPLFHTSHFLRFLKVKCKECVVSSPPYDRNSPSLPLPRSLCPSPHPPQSILDPRCQLWVTVKLYPSPFMCPPLTKQPSTPPWHLLTDWLIEEQIQRQ